MAKFGGKNRFGWQIVLIFALSGGLIFNNWQQSQIYAAERFTPEDIARLLPQFMMMHVKEKKLDPPFMKRILKKYVEHIDPYKNLLLKSDVEKIQNLSDDELQKLCDRALNADFTFFEKVMKDFLDKQVTEAAGLYDGLEKRQDEIRKEAEERDKKSFVARKLDADRNEIDDPNDDPDKNRWKEHPDSLEDRDKRLIKTVASYYSLNKSYLSENDAMRQALQTVCEDRAKWVKIRDAVIKPGDENNKKIETVQTEVPKYFLKSFLAAMDPHTAYFDPEDDEDFAARLERSFYGIGVQIRPSPLGALVDEVIAGGPTEKSGKIMRRDTIVAVDGFPLAGLPINKIVKRIKGELGTEVKVSVLKYDTKKTEIIPLKRDEIKVSEMRVTGRTIETAGGPVGVIRVESFYRGVAGDVKERIDALNKDKPLAGVVLDLRGNAGGYLEEAVNMAGLFIQTGAVVGEQDFNGRIDWKRDTNPSIYGMPLVMLVSQFSASASEIVSGTLKDYNRAVVVGATQTFGKGSVQRVLALSNLALPGDVKITTHQYFLAGGGSVQQKGVEPEIKIIGGKLIDEPNYLEKASENSIPASTIPGRIKADDPDYKKWTEWKAANLETIKEKSKARCDSNQDYKDAYDTKKLRAKALAEKEEADRKKKLNPDEPPEMVDRKKLKEEAEAKDFQAKEAAAIIADMLATWPPPDKSAAK